MKTYWCEYALLPGGLASGVRLTIDEDPSLGAGRYFVGVEPAASAGDAEVVRGVTVPGFANTHSHAFHRALRGRTHDGGGTFWTWRERMYHVAGQLNPDNYLDLARATYAEMALAGITSVGEFHYVHHNPDGTPYTDPNQMAHALHQAATDAGVRLTLLDTCYLAGGLTADGHTPLSPQQRRFGDGDLMGWAERVSRLDRAADFLIGAAMHSVRAVPFDQLQAAAAASWQLCDGTSAGAPLHIHLSEQPAENDACLAHYGRTPTRLIADAGLLDGNLTAVHATHLTGDDIRLLGAANAYASFCPTTERDLADGIGPAKALQDGGARIALGSDQHAVIDMFEEMRAIEMHERLGTNERGHFSPADLLGMATRHASIGWDDLGCIAVGKRADLVAVRINSPRTAGIDPAQVIAAATASEVTTVVRDGELIVADGHHRLGDVGRLLADAIAPFWEDA